PFLLVADGAHLRPPRAQPVLLAEQPRDVLVHHPLRAGPVEHAEPPRPRPAGRALDRLRSHAAVPVLDGLPLAPASDVRTCHSHGDLLTITSTAPSVPGRYTPAVAQPRCWKCGYDLAGLRVEDACPECGTPVWS